MDVKSNAYLQHCIAATEAGNDSRSPGALTLIDGAILGSLHVNVEHAYRMAHHRDVNRMPLWGNDAYNEPAPEPVALAA
jgi:hypothetical protein